MQENIWSVLGIEPTDDERAIKRAYATKVKIHSPEADPAGYMKLRAAYEQAKSHARYQQELAEQEPAHEDYSGESPAPPEIDSGPLPPDSAARAAPAATPQRLAIGDLQALLSRGELEKFLARLEEIKAEGTFASLDDQYHFVGTVAVMIADAEVVDSDWQGRVAEALGARESENIFTDNAQYWDAYDSLLEHYATRRRYKAQSHLEDQREDSAAPGYLHVYHVLTSPFDAERLSALTRSLTYHRLAERLLERARHDSGIVIPPENREWWERTSMAGQHRPVADAIAEPAPAPQPEDTSSRFPFWALGLVLVILFNATRSCNSTPSYVNTRPADFDRLRTELPMIIENHVERLDGYDVLSKSLDQCDKVMRSQIMLHVYFSTKGQRSSPDGTQSHTTSRMPTPESDPKLARLLRQCTGGKSLDPGGPTGPQTSTPPDTDLPPEP